MYEPSLNINPLVLSTSSRYPGVYYMIHISHFYYIYFNIKLLLLRSETQKIKEVESSFEKLIKGGKNV